MKVNVEGVDNGYIISYSDYDADDRLVERKIIVEEDDDTPAETSEHRAFARLCWELMEVLGIYNSKHKPQRVNIVVEKTDGREVSG